MTESDSPPPVHLGTRFVDAVGYAVAVHGAQTRKGGTIPYLAHLLGVASLVLDDGGTEDEAIAALLHDAPEDQGGKPRLADIRHRFGDRVGDIVAGCTDTTDERTKENSAARKGAFVERIRGEEDPAVLRVSLADKLHNARSMLADHRALGPPIWSRFNVGREEQLVYLTGLAEAFLKAKPGQMANELEAVVGQVRELIQSQSNATVDP